MRPATPLASRPDRHDRRGGQDSAPVTGPPEGAHIAHIPGRELPDEDVVVRETTGPGLALRLAYLDLGEKDVARQSSPA